MSLLDRLKESFPLSPLYELASYELMMNAPFSAARNSRARASFASFFSELLARGEYRRVLVLEVGYGIRIHISK